MAADEKSTSTWSCIICSAKEMGEMNFISHLLGKRHRKKAEIRMTMGESKNGLRRCIKGKSYLYQQNEKLFSNWILCVCGGGGRC